MIDSKNNNAFYLIRKGIKDHWGKNAIKGACHRKYFSHMDILKEFQSWEKCEKKKTKLLGVTRTRKINNEINNRGLKCSDVFAILQLAKK